MSTPLRLVLDTDAFNEVDDQFALVYALQSSSQLRVEAVYAAPFHNARSEGPSDGMVKSHEEILRVLALVNQEEAVPVFRGAMSWIPDTETPVESEAVHDLITRGMGATEKKPLYVAGIAAATNLASALLIEPRLIGRVCYVWLGGQPLYWPSADEFNLRQDVPAARVLFESGVSLIHVPCKNVAEHLRTCHAELAERIPSTSRTGNFLRERFEWYRQQRGFDTKPLWDIAAVAVLVDPSFVTLAKVPSPILTDEISWNTPVTDRHMIWTATELKRDAIYRDLFCKLAACP